MNHIKYLSGGRRTRSRRHILAVLCPLLFFFVSAAKGGVTITVVEFSGGVTISATGGLNLTSLLGPTNIGLGAFVVPGRADFGLGAADSNGTVPGKKDLYVVPFGVNFMQVDNFGDSQVTSAATGGTGDLFAITGLSELNIIVPEGYQSGAQISSSATFNGATISSIGMRPGVYVWSWGSGDNADSVIMTVPSPLTSKADNSAARVALLKEIKKLQKKSKKLKKKGKAAKAKKLLKKAKKLKNQLAALG